MVEAPTSTPMGIPISSHITAAPSASCSVMNIRSIRIGRSGSRSVNDFPNPGHPYWSPKNRCFMK